MKLVIDYHDYAVFDEENFDEEFYSYEFNVISESEAQKILNREDMMQYEGHEIVSHRLVRQEEL